MSYIDGHAHVFAKSTAVPRVVDDLAPAGREAPVAQLLDAMRDTGVGGAILVPLGAEDATVAAAVEAYPGRFAGVAVADNDELGAGGGAALRRRRERFRFSAVRMTWLGQPDRPLIGSPTWPVLQAMADDDLVLWSYLGPQQAELLPELVARLPGLRVVLNHLGFTPHDMRVDEHRRPRFAAGYDDAALTRVLALADASQVHLMVSGHYALSTAGPPYPDLAPLTRRLVGAYGADRCLWASDFPWPAVEPGYARTLRDATAMLSDLSAAEVDAVLCGTARRLFPETFTNPDSRRTTDAPRDT